MRLRQGHNRNMITRRAYIGIAAISVGVGLAALIASAAPRDKGVDARAVAEFWTPARMATAVPRDIVMGDAGRWYMRGADGVLHPYGAHTTGRSVAAKGKPVGSPSTTVKSAKYTLGGTVQKAAGRLYFRMPDDAGQLVGYLCSGTVVTDSRSDSSMILTAAHCVYDDAHHVFATDVMFIPNQSASGTRTDRNCANDVYGCWFASHAAVDARWQANAWPDNIPFDYGFYSVPTSGYHIGGSVEPSLEATVGHLDVAWSSPTNAGAHTYALGYSYKQDPYLMYCAQTLGTITSLFATGSYTNWWLSSCGLSGGASGGPWLQPAPGVAYSGSEPVLAVNSWGYQGKPGMAGPRLQTVFSPRPLEVYSATDALTSNGTGVVAALASTNA